MFDYQIFLTVCSFLLGMFVGIRISAPLDDAIHSAPLDDAIHEINTEPKDNGLLGRLIVENARLRVRLDAIELPHATHKYVCTHCSHMFNVGRNQEVFICPACGGSSEN